MADVIKRAAMGSRKMAVVFWCVMAITVIVFMHLSYNKDIGYGGLMAMMFIAALGGVDAWKQGMFDKIEKGNIQ